ncbi:hypothetical protein ACVIHD_007937 [Bradyrhizobium embrapense]
MPITVRPTKPDIAIARVISRQYNAADRARCLDPDMGG